MVGRVFSMKLFRWMLRALLVVLAVAVAIVAAYGAWLLFRAYWAPILLFAFLIVGCCSAVLGFFALHRAKRNSLRDSVVITVSQVTARAKISRFRLLLIQILEPIMTASGGWVYFAARGLRGPTDNITQMAASASLQGAVGRVAPTILVLALCAYLGAYLAPTDVRWERYFLALLAFHTMTRHGLYALALVPLPAQLRRTAGNAYVSFVVIAVCDLATMLLTLNAVLNWNDGQLASPDRFWDIFKGLFFAGPSELFQKIVKGDQPSIRELVLSGAGGLYGLTIVRTLYRFSEFRRTDEDYQIIAHSCCLLGKYMDALAYLSRVAKLSEAAHGTRAIAHLGIQQIDKAWGDARRVLELQGESPTDERVFFLLVNLVPLIPAPSASRIALLRRGLALKLRDLVIWQAVWTAEPGPLLESFKEVFAQSPAAEFPLSRVALFMKRQELEQARELLEGIESENPADQLSKSLLDILIRIGDPSTTLTQDRIAFDQWSATCYERLSGLVSLMKDLDLVLAFGAVVPIYGIAKKLGSPYEQSWLFLLNELQKSLGSSPQAALQIEILDRMLSTL
jgi:hypothetical protein